jgi:cytochrome c oxidase subunit 2
VWLRLESADVIHSFWVPRLAGKMDLIPGHSNAMWFTAETPGLYLGQCAEYCGTQHAHMLLRVYAEDSAQFDAWRAAQSKPGYCVPIAWDDGTISCNDGKPSGLVVWPEAPAVQPTPWPFLG